MEEFNKKLLRLKEATGITEDQGIAVALGLSKAAFSERKRRGSFPQNELYALCAKRPELEIDASYVLTGFTGLNLTRMRAQTMALNADEQRALSEVACCLLRLEHNLPSEIPTLSDLLPCLRPQSQVILQDLIARMHEIKNDQSPKPRRLPPMQPE